MEFKSYKEKIEKNVDARLLISSLLFYLTSSGKESQCPVVLLDVKHFSNSRAPSYRLLREDGYNHAVHSENNSYVMYH